MSVLSQQGAWSSLRIEEVLNGDLPLQPGDVIEASRYDDTFACYLGCASLQVGDEALALYRPEAPALPPCAEREACTAACNADTPQEQDEDRGASACACRASSSSQGSVWDAPTCDTELVGGPEEMTNWQTCLEACLRATDEDCPPRPAQDYKRGTVGLSPWTDPIVFARSDLGEVNVPVSELDQLWKTAADDAGASCRERFGDWSDLLHQAP